MIKSLKSSKLKTPQKNRKNNKSSNKLHQINNLLLRKVRLAADKEASLKELCLKGNSKWYLIR